MKKTLLLISIISIVIAGFLSTRGTLPFLPVMGVSMEPNLKAGDIITIEETSAYDVEVGDVIVYSVPPLVQDAYDYPPIVAHRVVRKEVTDTGVFFRTRGDNVAGEDPFTIRASDLKGAVGDRIPFAGFPLLFFQSQYGLIFMGIALSLLTVFFYTDEIKRGRRSVQRGIFAPVLEENQRTSKVLESRIGSTEKEILGTQQALEKFAFAIGEYAEHLKSHTSAIQGLSEASHELKRGAAEQNKVLVNLVEKMNGGWPETRAVNVQPKPETSRIEETLLEQNKVLKELIGKLSSDLPLVKNQSAQADNMAEKPPQQVTLTREIKPVPGHVTPRQVIQSHQGQAVSQNQAKPANEEIVLKIKLDQIPGHFTNRIRKSSGGDGTPQAG